jgi:hypothetical protein
VNAIERLREALALAAPRAVVDVAAIDDGSDGSADCVRVGLLKTTSLQHAFVAPREDGSAVLRVTPGATLSQARVLYSNTSRIDSLLRLGREAGWVITPSFHIGSGRGRAWMTPTADVGAYTNYWLAAMQRTRALKREEWPGFMTELLSRKLASPGDQAGFDAAFTDTKKKSASPSPSLACEKPLTARLDQPERLASEVVAELTQILRALREPLHTFA